MRAERRALSPAERLAHSQAVCRSLANSTLFRNSNKIAIYIENDGEIDVTRLLPLINATGKHCYLPVLRPMQPNRLWFSEYKLGDKLILNQYGIPEPDIRNRKQTALSGLDLALVPLVAFDVQCNRVGMGGGYYDRTFSYLRYRTKWRKPKLIGIAHELQKSELLQPNRWDVSLDGVVTESSIYIRSIQHNFIL